MLITSGRTPADRALAEVQCVLSQWPTRERRPEACAVKLADFLQAPTLDEAKAAWVRLDEADVEDEALYDALEELEQHHVPTLLTRAEEHLELGTEFADGVVVCPPHTPSVTIYAMLRSLWSQGSSLQQLDRQLQLMQAQQGSLTGQIDQIDEELRLAAELQREFLPRTMPEIPRMGAGVFWRPAGYVSGDIYDVLRLDEHRVGLFVADAVGHGVPAALMTMYIKRSLHTKQMTPDLPGGYRIIEPSETLAKLNRDLLQRDARHVRFTTACYAVLDTRFGTLNIARAGHPYPLLLRAGGKTELIDPEGPLLGVFPDEPFEQKRYDLEPGDRLLIYSDGFEMAFASDDSAGTGHRRIANMNYEREFEDLRHGSLDDALVRLQQRIDTQAGSLNQRDDLTVLCIEMGQHTRAPRRSDNGSVESHGFNRLKAPNASA